MTRDFAEEKRRELRYQESLKAQDRAKDWWKGKPDPKKALGQFNCWKCSLPILEKEGTSLIDEGILGERIRCADCTRHMWYLPSVSPRPHPQQVVQPSIDATKDQLDPCKKCGEGVEKGITTCPFCGNTQWGLILGTIFFGSGSLALGIRIGVMGGKMGSIVFGGLGALLLLVSIYWIFAALKPIKTNEEEK